MLQLAELARKMETQAEQVLPFAPPEVEVTGDADNGPSILAPQGPSKNYQPPRAPGEASPGSSLLPPPPQQSSVWTPAGTYVPPADRLWHFQRKFNKALLDDLAVQREKARLEAENAQLEDLIAQYLEGTTVSDDVLRDNNPLFVVNGRYDQHTVITLQTCS